MGKLTRIDSQGVVEFYHEIYGVQSHKLIEAEDKMERLEKSDIKKGIILKEDETTIYEYDYECMKKSGLIDRICKDVDGKK